MEMARKAAEDGLEILSKSKVRLETVTPATYSYYAPMPAQPPPERNPITPPRWCDVDDEMENDPLVNLENWKMGVSQNAESSYNDVVTAESAVKLREKEVCIEGRALREAPHVSHRRIEGLALREAPHVSHKVANEGKSEFEPIRIDPLNCDGFGGPSRAKLDERQRLNKAKYQERLKVRHELVKNILEKDPLSGKPWNICAKTSKKVAREFLQKWKPQMLHLEVGHGSKMDAVLDLIEAQRMAGRKFVLVGQLQSGSWSAPAARKILKMCLNTQVIVNQVGGGPKTRVVTNDVVLADAVKCKDGRRMRLAPNVVVSLAVEESMDVQNKSRAEKNVAMYHAYDETELHEVLGDHGSYIDDISGESLNPAQVKAARKDELKTFKEMEVYEYAKRSDVTAKGKVVGTRWLDSLKGGKMKARLVAQEFAKGSNRDDIFAATPPLMASRFVVSDTASRGKEGNTSRRIAIFDVKRAFLHGLMEEYIYIYIYIYISNCQMRMT